MCGIAGFIEPAGRRTGNSGAMQAVVRRMTETLAHRGPDAFGDWMEPEAGLCLGHRRLSIIDRSPLGGQPMISGDGRYVLVYNGEIYNFRELRAELESEGLKFHGHSDTEVLLGAVERWGISGAVTKSTGMFAFAVWDRQRRCLTLARDRLGEKPLYYGWSRGTFLFASELKALRAHPEWDGAVNRDAVASFMRHGYIPGPLSIYQGIHKLPAGTLLDIPAGATPFDAREPLPYWSLRAVALAGEQNPFGGSETEAVDAFEQHLSRTVRERMTADVPLGVFLSGGVDSSAVAALMQAQSASPVPSFTLGFREPENDESGFARAVADHLGTRHTAFILSAQEALGVIPDLPEIYDEPFADPSQIPTTWLARQGRRQVSVSLTGDGGDELLAGYARYRKGEVVRRRYEAFPPAIRGAFARLLRALPPGRPERGGRLSRLADLLSHETAEATYLQVLSQWKHPEELVRGAREPRLLLHQSATWPRLSGHVPRMMYLDAMTYLPDDILVKLDRASMAVGLELRAPFLDHRLVEFAWTLPASLKADKWLLRQVLRRYVPPALTDRPKRGFGIPLASWLRGPLKPWAEALLDETTLREQGFLNVARVRGYWQDHLSGRRDWKSLLWPVLMFQAWLEKEKNAR